jgi:predicted DNA-binding protein (MmcQ/YjbR family)
MDTARCMTTRIVSRWSYPFTEHCWPFGPEYDVFKVGGKIFMLTMTVRGRALVNLKCDPQNRCFIRQFIAVSSPAIT